MMRWWWFGPRTERTDLIRDLDHMVSAGIGGVELSVVYPLSEDTDRYMSQTFLADVLFAAEAAAARNMRFDLTLGTGWSFGGPHITDATAARRLSWDRRDIAPSGATIQVPQGWPGDEFLAAYVGDGSIQEPPTQFDYLPVSDGRIQIPVGRGPRVLLLCTTRLTGQQVKRAAAGAEGPVLDHYSLDATRAHIAAVCDPFLDAVPAELLGSVFCDSLEAYAADWTPGVLGVFREEHGYDPLPLLYHLHIPGEAGATLRADYYSTLVGLYEQNFVRPLSEWAAERGVPFRIQGYGEPPSGISSYRLADAFEGEGWGWRELTQTRWATSAAHLYDRNVVSSETWTWIHSPSFRATPMDLRGEAHEHLLAGINQFIGHGWPHSPSSLPGVGWMLYAAGAFDPRNPWWPAMPALVSYLHRLSWIMRQGSPVADIGVYATPRAVSATMYSDVTSSLNLWKATKDFIGDPLIATIRESGFDYDAWDDDAAAIAVERYPVLILPEGSEVPARTAGHLAGYITRGGHVIAMGSDSAPVPGALLVADIGELAEALAVLLGGADAWVSAPDVGVTHRRDGDHHLYFVANTGPTPVDATLRVRTPFAIAEEWDATTGRAQTVATPGAGHEVPLRLEPYAATVFVTAPHLAERSACVKEAHRPWTSEFVIERWEVRFADEDRGRVVTAPHIWEDELEYYSGSAEYVATFMVDGTPPKDAELDFGPCTPVSSDIHDEVGIRGRSFRVGIVPPVGEIAEVEVNGQPAGVVWASPYRVDVGGLLRAGANSITLRVANTAGNRVAADPSVRATAEASARVFGRRFRMQDLDLADDGVRSGLLTSPVLRVRADDTVAT